MQSSLDTKPEREIRPKFQKIRIFLRDKISKSLFLQSLYAFLCESIARIRIANGSKHDALNHLLRAQRNVEPGIFGKRRGLLINKLLNYYVGLDGTLCTVSENLFLSEYVQSDEAREIREAYRKFPSADMLRMRIPRDNDDPERQGNLIILKKWNPEDNDKGVILLKYNTAIESFPALFDLSSIVKHYQIVLEPSFKGYQHQRFLLYVGSDAEVVVMSQYLPDFNYLQSLASNLVPIRLGAADWVDPDIFGPPADENRQYDIVMLAAWSRLKRHELLFKAIYEIKNRHNRMLNIALIGYPWDWKIDKIQELLETYKLSDNTRIYESIPHENVADILKDSKISVFLSPMEGASKALYESIFCGAVPIIHRQNQGIDLEKITSDVGKLADENDLSRSILHILDNFKSYKPYEWAVNNTGCYRSTSLLESVLRQMSSQEKFGELTPKKNAPHLRYAKADIYNSFESEYQKLENYLI